jgi:hypothetical protein
MLRATGIVLLFALSITVPATAARAELAAWDQTKVTALASDLAESAQGLQGALRRQPPPTLGQPGRRAFWTLRDEMQGIVAASRRLHSALSSGAGQEETYPIYRRILRNARRAARETRRIQLGDPVPQKIEAIADTIRALRPFYEEEAPL